MERFFNDSKTIRRFRSGPLGIHIHQLAEELAEQGFARRLFGKQIRSVITLVDGSEGVVFLSRQ